jgi:glutamine synthetase
MQHEDLVFVATCDLAGQVRGKAFPAAEWEARLAGGVGYTHSNIMMSAFGPIQASPFTTAGDLTIVPDPTARVDLAFPGAAGEHFCLGDIRTLDGADWECCPRSLLRRALAALREQAGLSLLAAFEQEFVYTGLPAQPYRSYALATLRDAGLYPGRVVAALRDAGLHPDSFLPEYGPRQMELTVGPTPGLRAADEAVIAREILRAVARQMDRQAILAPMLTPDGIGNGTHIHFSLLDKSGAPVLYAAEAPMGLSGIGQGFAAGILAHMPALCALTAAAVPSYMRLTPNRWAPTRADLGVQDRGVALRVCPVFADPARTPDRQFNLEYRVADAAASPYMALAGIVLAGLDGLQHGLELPGATGAFLPRSLPEALDALEADSVLTAALGPTMTRAYLMLKRAEAAFVEDADPARVCTLYAEVY